MQVADASALPAAVGTPPTLAIAAWTMLLMAWHEALHEVAYRPVWYSIARAAMRRISAMSPPLPVPRVVVDADQRGLSRSGAID